MTTGNTIFDTESLIGGTTTTNDSSIYVHNTGGYGTNTSSQWTVPDNSTLEFTIDGKTISFSSTELIRLKEMLTKFIENEHPEDLL